MKARPPDAVMFRNLLLICAGALLLPFAGCKKHATSEPGPPQTETRGNRQVNTDSCALLSHEEIQQVQGSPVKDTKGSGTSDGRIRVLQCYYSTEESSRSVSLMVTQNDPAASNKNA